MVFELVNFSHNRSDGYSMKQVADNTLSVQKEIFVVVMLQRVLWKYLILFFWKGLPFACIDVMIEIHVWFNVNWESFKIWTSFSFNGEM